MTEKTIKNEEFSLLDWINSKCQVYLMWFNAYTFVVWALLMAEYFTNGQVKLPVGLTGIYIAYLTNYIGQKEVTRWWLHKNYNRSGEAWVSLWMLTGLIVYIIQGVAPGKFTVPSSQLITIIGITITYFSATKVSKISYKTKHSETKK